MLRFKLYTVEVGEVYNLVALARIKPMQLQFDPHFYLYGGAFLYPLGLYYAVLSKLGVLSIGSLDICCPTRRQSTIYGLRAGSSFCWRRRYLRLVLFYAR